MDCQHTSDLSHYCAGALAAPLPEMAQQKTKLHVLDTLAAIISGAHLPGGRAGARAAARMGGPKEALSLAD